ncbi:MAG TPA: hypothetical protein VKZ91_09135 [Woeseiaceae bacterium]|nr:hypothetical protein [Woeseiaceae bacterium]
MFPNLSRLLSALTILALPALAAAQEEDLSTIPWAYSTYFGTGWYKVGEDRDAFAIRYAPRKPLREAVLHEDGSRTIGIELRLPFTVGLDHFPLDDLQGSVDPANLANISVTPSIYFDIPMNERWTLRPFVAAGWGTVLNGDESAWTYWTGLRSRLAFNVGKVNAALLNSIGFVGYTPNVGSSTNFWPVQTAVEMATPLGNWQLDERQVLLHWHFGYTYFTDDLDIVRRDLTTEPISDQWELGLAVSKVDAQIEIWRFKFDRVGLAYRFSSDGKLQGVGFVFRSLFDK